MRRSWFFVLAAFVLLGAGVWFFREFSESDQLQLSCQIDKDLRAYKLTPDRMLQAHSELEPLIDGDLPMSQRLKQIEALVCNDTLTPASRLIALDFLFENMAILTVLNDQVGLKEAWINPITGSAGTVNLITTGRADNRVCTVVDYPSMIPGISAQVVVTARERYCRPDSQDEWFSDEILGYDTYRFEDSNAGPKTIT